MLYYCPGDTDELADMLSLCFPKADTAVLDQLAEYLDTSCERDDTLLAGLKIPPMSGDALIAAQLGLNGIIRWFANRTCDPELSTRLFIALQAVYPREFRTLLNEAVASQDSYLIEKALALRYGSDAPAVMCAGSTLYWGNKIPEHYTPEVFARALYYCDRSDIEKILMLCAYAFNTPVQEKMPEFLYNAERITASLPPELSGYDESTLSAAYAALAFGAYHSERIFEKLRSSINAGDEALRHGEIFVTLHIHGLPVSGAMSMLLKAGWNPGENGIQSFIGVSTDEDRSDVLRELALKYRTAYFAVMTKGLSCVSGREMEKIYLSLYPDSASGGSPVLTAARRVCAVRVSGCLDTDRAKVRGYLSGKIPVKDILPVIANSYYTYHNDTYPMSDYYTAYGEDDFFRRCLVVSLCTKLPTTGLMTLCLGFNINNEIQDEPCLPLRILLDEGVPAQRAFAAFDSSKEDIPYFGADTPVNGIIKYSDAISRCDITPLGEQSRGAYIAVLGKDVRRYKDKLIQLCGDTTPAVRATLLGVFADKPELHGEIAELLENEDRQVRSFALDVMEKQGRVLYGTELETALDRETDESLRVKIYMLLGGEISDAQRQRLASDMTAASSRSRYARLFAEGFSPVRDRNGNTVSANTLKALISCFSAGDNDTPPSADTIIADTLDRCDLERFCDELFGRWIENGASTAYKHILYLCAVCGSDSLTDSIVKYAQLWAGKNRAFLAADAVNALAFSGTPYAINALCGLSFRAHRARLRNAAAKAIRDKAAQAGLTADELIDLSMPDMGFDERMCLVLDYGRRSFEVYVTPSHAVEIFSGGKRLRTLPKPGARDDREKALPAYEKFTCLKKQIKTLTDVQSRRLEHALISGNTRPADRWERLFVKNPVMNIFSSGLIWGIYDGDRLIETFRYMNDGSYTDAQGNEFFLPQGAEVGMIHPAELSPEETAAWKEQLNDFETVQPVPQLDRQVFTATPAEENSGAVVRFYGATIGSFAFCSSMIKNGWHEPDHDFSDDNMFNKFCRTDISPSGTVYTELGFSGTSRRYYDIPDEAVTVGDLVFRRDSEDGALLTPGQTGKRFFSEIMLSLAFLR